MDGPLPALVVGGRDGQPPAENRRGGPTKPGGGRRVAFSAGDEMGEGQLLYGGAAMAGAPGAGTMSRVLSLRSAKGVSSLYDFNPDDPAELLASGCDLPSMRGIPDVLSASSPRAKAAAKTMRVPATNKRPAYVSDGLN